MSLSRPYSIDENIFIEQQMKALNYKRKHDIALKML